VFGNIDKKRSLLAHAVKAASSSQTIGIVYQETLSGVRIGACHGHESDVLEAMIQCGDYDLVFHGHFHVRKDEMIESTRVISPGALGGTYHEPRSVCVYDLENGLADVIEIARPFN
jgi:predicted phosphodiesterase